MVIFHKVGVKEAKRIVEGIRVGIAECSLKDVFEDKKVSCTVSGGIDEIRYGDILENVLGRADKKLYRAKFLGKNRVIAWAYTGAILHAYLYKTKWGVADIGLKW